MGNWPWPVWWFLLRFWFCCLFCLVWACSGVFIPHHQVAFPFLQFTAATPEDDNKYKRNSESETNSPYIVVGTFEGLCPSNTFAGLPDTPSLEGAYEHGLLDGNLGQMASFQSTYKSTLRIEVWGPWGPSLPLPRKGFIAGTQHLPHKRKHKTTRSQSQPMQRMPMKKLRRKRMTSMWRRRGKDASPFDKASCSEPKTDMLPGVRATNMRLSPNGSSWDWQ